MQEMRVRFVERIKRTSTIESFRLVPEAHINFIPGQFLQVIFDQENRDNKDLNKYLSFSCSPAKEYIEVTKRLSESPFSGKLKSLKIGDEVLIKTPLGACVFNEGYRKIAFLIGGIGITPVISIIEYIVDKKLDTDVILLYSNRTDKDIAFKEELDLWQKFNKNIKIIYLVTDAIPEDKTCIQARLDKDLVLAEVGDIKERIVFIFGPPKMVEALKALCLEIGCNEENLKTESFIGY